MGYGYKVQPMIGKMKQKPTMPAGKPQLGPSLTKAPMSGIPPIPGIRPTGKRNLSPIKVNTGSLY